MIHADFQFINQLEENGEEEEDDLQGEELDELEYDRETMQTDAEEDDDNFEIDLENGDDANDEQPVLKDLNDYSLEDEDEGEESQEVELPQISRPNRMPELDNNVRNYDFLKSYLIDIFGKLSFCQNIEENIISMNLAFFSLIAINTFVPLLKLGSTTSSSRLITDEKLHLIAETMYPTSKLFWLMVPMNEDFEETVVRSVRKMNHANHLNDATVDMVCNDLLPNEGFPLSADQPEYPMLSTLESAVTEESFSPGNAAETEPQPRPVDNSVNNVFLGLWSNNGKQDSPTKHQVTNKAYKVFQSMFDGKSVFTSETQTLLQKQRLRRLEELAASGQKASSLLSMSYGHHARLNKFGPGGRNTASGRPDFFFLDDEEAFGGVNTLNQRIFQSALLSLTSDQWLTPEERSSPEFQQATEKERDRFALDRQRAVLLHVTKVISLCMELVMVSVMASENNALSDVIYWFYRPLQICLQSIICDNIRQVYQETYEQKRMQVANLAQNARSSVVPVTEMVKDFELKTENFDSAFKAASAVDQEGKERSEMQISPIYFYLTDIHDLRLLSKEISSEKIRNYGEFLDKLLVYTDAGSGAGAGSGSGAGSGASNSKIFHTITVSYTHLTLPTKRIV